MDKTDFIIFTDLDGTLLDRNSYSFSAAIEALNRIKEMNIPLILCSSKTKAEIEIWRERLDNNDPFISENGGAIFFSDNLNSGNKNPDERDGYRFIELGIPYTELMARFNELKNKFGDRIRGFSEMDVDELVGLTGLSQAEAVLAKQREYTEPFVFKGSKTDEKELEKSIEGLNLSLTKGGRFYCLLGDNDKGKAVKILTHRYRKSHSGIETVAIGDGYNDLPMLKAVDVPILVQKPGGSYDIQIDIPKLHRAHGVGPVGWNAGLMKILPFTVKKI